MANFRTSDNNGGKKILSLNSETEETDYKAAINDIQKISNKSLAELSSEANLLVFPTHLNKSADLLKESKICSLTKSDQLNESILLTENIAGFIGINGTTISITSRFTEEEEDYFLHYMIQKVLNLNVTNLDFTSSDDNVLNLLVYLFPCLLQKALMQGLYKEYQTFHKNDENVRGVIELSRYIKENIPFEGKIAYKTREYSYDNTTTELIRHTIEFISAKKDIAGILTSSQENREAVKIIKTATPRYIAGERQKVIAAALKSKRHPYFTQYIPLQKLCIQILLNKKIRLSRKQNRIYGLLFDISWLWEQYLATILKQVGFKHPDNRKGTGSIAVLKNNLGRFVPDFYKEDFVLDAKYKSLDKHNPPSDDLSQVIAYMHILSIDKGGYIYPAKNEPQEVINELGEIKGKGGMLYLCPFHIPQNCNTFSKFSENIKKSEMKLLEVWGMRTQ